MRLDISVLIATVGGMLVVAGLLHATPRLGRLGRRVADSIARAPLLDVAVFLLTAGPAVGALVAGVALGTGFWSVVWLMVVAGIGQIVAMQVWIRAHELVKGLPPKENRITTVLNARVGRFRNHAAVWCTAPAIPVFWAVRFAEIFVYPFVARLAGLPRYRHREWVSVSRQKFDGLVGHDRIWCLYCDWMTGVWSLGGEMLRNVESFWCPIRFLDAKKCANCVVDFPDVAEWTPAGGTMAQVADLLREKHSGDKPNAWFGHPVRLTVGGSPAETLHGAPGRSAEPEVVGSGDDGT